MLFGKNQVCQKCNIASSKKEICFFDYSLQGQNQSGKKIILCQNCCEKELDDNLKTHTQRAVIIQPSSKYNAYAFYSFNKLVEKSQHSINRDLEIKTIEDIKSFLPTNNEKCSICSRHADFAWNTLAIFEDSNPESMHINLEEKKNSIYFCFNCSLEALNKKIRSENINFRAIYPIVDSDEGYYVPWYY